ncbi:XdhC family protein [Streptomyces albireticuli]|uniref:XdhC family protein n=1 Tax=Streptomyces albireticuli TaxID=1940 RepID=UPI001B80547D|nr:XdhC/CoxI family protein [Streptomyces albireticuli]MCD9140674.1 XdhC family protein [Streptomyces albireticuli]MCD9161364.1 XdhC family protein [Streptomyces albireticuli]MCD9190578.1 XdhC family protein [Streptomyces albireticuli]
MLDLADELRRWCAEGREFAVATVVAVTGSAPRQPGAALAVDTDGTVIGSVSGGCVEGAVYELCLAALASGESALERFGYSDEDAFAVGLTCGGVLDVLITPVRADAPDRPVLAAALATAARGGTAALARVAAGPAHLLGRALLVAPDGGVTGTLGGTEALDRVAGLEAAALLDVGRTGTVEVGEGPGEGVAGTAGDLAREAGASARDRASEATGPAANAATGPRTAAGAGPRTAAGAAATGGGDRDAADSAPPGHRPAAEGGGRGTGPAAVERSAGAGGPGGAGSPCGEPVTLLVESVVPAPRMIVFGAVDFAAALVSAGKFLGYHVTVCDARPVFATSRRFPGADEVVVEWPHRYLDSQELDRRAVLCVLTHDAKFDVPLLERALRLPVAYVGAMGSRRTHEARLDRLREAGVSERELGRLRSPIGLDLGARTPEETALSIAAEIVAVRRGGTGAPLTGARTPIHHDHRTAWAAGPRSGPRARL